MATYKEIRGTHIKTVTTDPPAPVNGQMWYNSTTQVMKGFTSNPAGAWATGGNLNTARYTTRWSRNSNSSISIWWNNSPTWSNRITQKNIMEQVGLKLADLNTAREIMGDGGTQTSANAGGGISWSNKLASTESWNGTTWTEVCRFKYSKKISCRRYNICCSSSIWRNNSQ